MKNNVAIANFNVTFGKQDEPMLNYFETIIFPAFTSGIKREYRVSAGANSCDKYLSLIHI